MRESENNMQTTLPKGWKMVKLDEIVNVDKGKKMATIMSHSKDCQPYIGIDNLRTTQYTNFTKEKDGLSCIETDLLIAWDGANAGTIGYGLKGYVGSTIARLRPSESTTTYYLGHFLKSKFQQFNIQTHGAAIPHLSKSQLLNTLIPLPPLPTQHKIVEILEEADNLRKLRQQADEKMKALIPSLFVQMFGDPATNPKGWEVKCIDDIKSPEKFSIVDGPFGSSMKVSDYVERGIPVLQVGNITPAGFCSDSFRYITEEKYNALKRSTIYKGDILIAKVGHTIGKACIMPDIFERAIITANCARIKVNERITTNIYVNCFINSSFFQNQIRKELGNTAKPMMNLSSIKSFKILLPPLALQQEFSKLVEDIEAEKARQAESRKKLDELFDSLMQRAFTGELVA